MKAAIALSLFLLSVALQGQDMLTLARMNEDIKLVTRKVGRLELELESLQRQNEQLAANNEALAQELSALNDRYNQYVSSVENRLNRLPDADRQMKAEILAEVRRLMKEFAVEVEKAIEGFKPAIAAAHAAATAAQNRPAPVYTPVDDGIPQNGVSHEVEAGDTFSKIAAKYNSRVSWIQEKNKHVDPSRLKVGMKLFVPQETR